MVRECEHRTWIFLLGWLYLWLIHQLHSPAVVIRSFVKWQRDRFAVCMRLFYLLVVVLILTHTKTLPHTLPTLFVFCVFTFSPFISFHISLWNITKLVLKNRKFHSPVAQSSRFDNMKFVRLHTVNVRWLQFSALHLITVMNLIILYLVGVIIVLKKSFIYFFGRATFFPAPFENAASFWMPHFWALNRIAILAPISAQ